MSEAVPVVDARGLLCPWPVLRLARAARQGAKGNIRLLADDPSAPAEIAQLCSERGWQLDRDPRDDTLFEIAIG